MEIINKKSLILRKLYVVFKLIEVAEAKRLILLINNFLDNR